MKKIILLAVLLTAPATFCQVQQHFVKENYKTATSAGFSSCVISVWQVKPPGESYTPFIRNLSATDTLFIGFRYAGSTNVDTTAPYFARVFPSETRTFTRVPIDTIWVKSTGASTNLYYGSQADFIR